MAIFTRFGSEIELINVIDDDQLPDELWFHVQYQNGKQGQVAVWDLKADGGLAAITQIAETLPHVKG